MPHAWSHGVSCARVPGLTCKLLVKTRSVVFSGSVLSLLLPHRYVLTDIIGKDEGFGVENLRASGTIAGESSIAYDEIVTISMVWLLESLADFMSHSPSLLSSTRGACRICF